jgi:hypothetical protein
MSEEKYSAGEVYDLTQNLKGLEINTGFILGLERILVYFLTKVIEDKSTIPPMFKKFEELLSPNTAGNPPQLTEMEAHIYTLFALQQLLRASAYDQNLVRKVENAIKDEDIKDFLKAYVENNADEAKSMYDKMQQDLSSKV